MASQGSRLLREWRLKAGMKQTPAAERLGIKQSGLSDLEVGRRKAGRGLAVRIASVTGGAVPIESWGIDEEPEAKAS